MPFTNILAPGLIALAIIFLFISLSLLMLARIRQCGAGPKYWSLGFLLNAVGFSFWASNPLGVVGAFFLLGDFVHMLGFIALLTGVMTFVEHHVRLKYVVLLVAVICIWGAAALVSISGRQLNYTLLMFLRSGMFLWGGWLVLRYKKSEEVIGRALAGACLIGWGVTTLLMPFWMHVIMVRVVGLSIMAAFHVASAMGMIVMLVDRLRDQAESEKARAERLEGLLPICSGCKKIRDDEGRWEPIEHYISRHSRAQFSHGLCDDCLCELYPDISKRILDKRKAESA